ncbi:MAG TPA: FG-GAP-like repeat-containing protein, partial [Puia sp.]|nr:FG-GAP-like repeat-containing protein [Puia sp.]
SGFGISVASAGDVNGDGYSDVIVGTLGGGGGFAYVYKGSATGIANKAAPDYSLTGVGGDFGVSVSSAGDVNGDGYSDVIVGASNVNGYIISGGAASIFLGGIGGLSTTPSTVLLGINPGDQFGATVSSAGDVNGDGYSDVIVRATLATSSSGAQTGAAYLYLGGPTGLSSTIATSFLDEGSANANLEGFNLRRSVASAGDVNGDGYSDVLVGVYEDATAGFKAGATHVYYGNNANGNNASNRLRLYETNLTSPIAADNLTQPNFGLGLFVQSPFGAVKGRLVWETEGNGAPFLSSPPNPITNSVALSGNQTSYSAISPGGTEFKNLIPKALAKATKVRVRIQYASSATTFGQVFSPWIYSQAYLQGSNTGILPLNLLSFTATASGENIVLNWKTSNEVNLQKYVIEHSLNTMAFDSIGQVAATGNSFSASSYDFTHFAPGAGIHFYRLKEVDVNGHFTYSRVVSAKINSNVAALSIFPNPASDHIIIKHNGISGNYIRIMNASGSIVGQYLFDPSSAQSTISVKSLARGNYFVEIVNSGYTPKQIALQ